VLQARRIKPWRFFPTLRRAVPLLSKSAAVTLAVAAFTGMATFATAGVSNK